MNNNSNKLNGVRQTASGSSSTSLYNQEQNLSKPQRQSSSSLVLPTFFKWFKKSNHRKSSPATAKNTKNRKYFNSSSSAIETFNYHSDRESISPPSSPQFHYINKSNQLSPSISCDSVLSTSTTGFAFVRPSHYLTTQHDVVLNQILAENNHQNSNIHTNSRQIFDINPPPLFQATNEQINYKQHKYYLYETGSSGTFLSLNTNDNQLIGNYDNIEFVNDNNLIEKQENAPENQLIIKRHQLQRRTFSDNTKDKRSGAYVHVIGKRKAPDPPLDHYETTNFKGKLIHQKSAAAAAAAVIVENRLYRTLTPLSTLVRKKRKAPQPPAAILLKSTDQLTVQYPIDEQLIQKTSINSNIPGNMSSSVSNDTISTSSVITTSLNKDLDENTQNDSSNSNNSLTLDEQIIPAISPRPWYKRSIPMNRDSVIPFKREIILRTMEKRKNKQKNQPILPEISYNRASGSGGSSIFDTGGNKFSFFGRHKENIINNENNVRVKENAAAKEKRQSIIIGMPNISELDREATEIIQQEKTNNNLYKTPDHLILQQQMFQAHKAAKDQQADQQPQILNDIEETSKSTKELITKFELSSSTIKTTLNTSFIGRTENFINSNNQQNHKRNEENIKLVKEVIKLSPIYNNNNMPKNHENQSKLNNKQDDLSAKHIFNSENLTTSNEFVKFTKMTWSCPLCTLENPNWRIICEVCEKIKPTYDENHHMNQQHKSTKIQPNNDIEHKLHNTTDWDKKTEQVKKYFIPKNSAQTSTATSVTSTATTSATSVIAVIKENPDDYLGNNSKVTSKLPIYNSPKLNRSNLPSNSNITTTNNSNFKLNNNEINLKNHVIHEEKVPLLNSSEVITTTVTPVFYATQIDKIQTNTRNSNHFNDINLDEIRNARLAKFTTTTNVLTAKESSSNENENHQKNDNNLEKTGEMITVNLELEKKRLRDKIRAMNAKALAEKYSKNLLENETNMKQQQHSPTTIGSTSRGDLATQQLLGPGQMSEAGLPKQQQKQQLLGSTNRRESANQYMLGPGQRIDFSEIDLPPLEQQQPIPPKRINILDKNKKFKHKSHLTNNNEQILGNTSNNNNKLGAIKKVFTKNTSKTDKNKLNQPLINIDNNNNKPKKVSSSAQTSGLYKKQQTNTNTSGPNLKIYENFNESKKIDQIHETIYSNVIPSYENQYFNSEKCTRESSNLTSNETLIDDSKKSITQNENNSKLKSVEKLNDQKLTSNSTSSSNKTSSNGGNSKHFARTDTLLLNKITKNLEVAILNGKHEMAAKLAMDLAKMKVSLQVTKIKKSPNEKPTEQVCDPVTKFNKTIIVDMYVEDQISQKGPIQISIQPTMTLRELKIQAFIDYNIPMTLQRWLLNKQMLTDESCTLMELGIQKESSILYLFILKSDLNTKYNTKIQQSSSNNDTKNSQVNIKLDLQNDTLSTDDDDGAKSLDFDVIDQQNNCKKFMPPIRAVSASWQCKYCTLINHENVLACSACFHKKPLLASSSASSESKISSDLKKTLENEENCKINTTNLTTETANSNKEETVENRPVEKRNDLNKKSPNRKSTDIYNITEEIEKSTVNDMAATTNASNVKTTINAEKFSPHKIILPPNLSKPFIITEVRKTSTTKMDTPSNCSTKITTKLEPTYAVSSKNANNIAATATASIPASASFASPNITKSKYRGVDNFNPFRKDYNEPKLTAIKNKAEPPINSITNNLSLSLSVMKPFLNYMEILKLDTTDIVQNKEKFECPICFIEIDSGAGAVLRDCLHTFCKECLQNTIQYTEDVEIQCPYANPEYSCTSLLQEREIRALVTKEIYEKHLTKSVRFAEYNSENAFHCKTPNCRGWCIYEDNVNQFKCPVCQINNCLTCRVIHDGLTCKQYQDRLTSDCDSSLDARRTKEMLQEMVATGEAMNCPTCQVIMMKKWGCDWLRCSMCKTEVCWVTRGPRWGPAGKGDTTAGCKCGVNGVKCHPKCNYCH